MDRLESFENALKDIVNGYDELGKELEGLRTDGKTGHEIMFLYKVEIPKNQIQEEYVITEGETKSIAKWIDKEEVLDGKKVVYPEIIRKYI
ncbi:MAG: hypothetical protein FWF46_03125 [Oscillospiraceae bacterium]|nr:hypothetical protein [Oscillospiraceae bacterium]